MDTQNPKSESGDTPPLAEGTGTNYEVGYKKPPISARFKPGVSGNPKGRARKTGNEVKKEPRPRKPRKRPETKVKETIELIVHKLTPEEISDMATNLPLEELRNKWEQAWGIKPHKYIGRQMLEKSLVFKLKELNGLGLSRLQRERLDDLVKTYKRNPRLFGDRVGIKVGTRLVRVWKGEKILVKAEKDGFEYNGTVYKSLSATARAITGISWNGWAFFGLKRPKR